MRCGSLIASRAFMTGCGVTASDIRSFQGGDHMGALRLQPSLVIDSPDGAPRLRCGANGRLARAYAQISASAKAAR
jgi:hypothetical protein